MKKYYSIKTTHNFIYVLFYNVKYQDRKQNLILRVPLNCKEYRSFCVLVCNKDGGLVHIYDKSWWWLQYPMLKSHINRRQHEDICNLWIQMITDNQEDCNPSTIRQLSPDDIITIIGNILNKED